MPMTAPMECIKCGAPGTKSTDGMQQATAAGWLSFEGMHNALNRDVHLCPACAKAVPERRSMLDSVGVR
jgi:hypothetical protein